MSLHLRAEWADRSPNLTPAKKGVGYIVIHHTAGSASMTNKAAALRGLEHSVTDHPAPGNSSPLIALDYNLMVFADGDVWAGRGLQFEDGATYRFNDRSVSICAVGNYDVDRPPPALLTGIAYAIQVAIAGGYVVPDPVIEGHRDVGTFATACPGRFLEAQIPTIHRLATGGTLGDPAPAPTVQEDEMFRVIKGDKSPRLFFSNFLTKREINTSGPDKGLPEAAALIASGATGGADAITWPQAYVDSIPLVK